MATKIAPYQEFVDYVVKALVSKPEKVEVERSLDERGVLLTLKVDPSDMGYVIGRGGQTARALRVLLRMVGAKNNARVNLKIYEPGGSQEKVAGLKEEEGKSEEEVEELKL
jgi:hypothetical protein